MPIAPKPGSELDRLLALRSYEILDTAPTQEFDDLTQIASQMLNCPVSVVSLVDEERQWFKSCVGLDAEQTSRDVAFCAYTILDTTPMVVTDATSDPRVSDNALVTGDPGIRFYAGVPLIDSDGFALGSFCVIDFEPRDISEGELEVLKALGRQVVSQLELHKHIINAKQLVDDLKQAQGKAQAASEAKSSFLASMSHELRTPMNSIIGFTKRLKKGLKETISDRNIDALDTIERNANHLLSLINEILDLSKIEAGKMELEVEECEMSSIIKGVVDCLKPQAETKCVELSAALPEGLLNITADKTKVTQVVMNLASNAVKFTDEGSVSIELKSVERDGAEFVEVAVKDTGTGIKEEDLCRLFSEFTQLSKDEEKRKGGTGLGLTISKKFIEMHGGEITANSSYGKGSEFTFSIPAGKDSGNKV